MSDCLFCRIARHEIPVEAVLETDQGMVIPDIDPKAPVHLLVIPKTHFADVGEATVDESLLGHLMALAARAAFEKGLMPGGYRIVANTGPDAGQSVPHLHLHVFGGRKMDWTPG